MANPHENGQLGGDLGAVSPMVRGGGLVSALKMIAEAYDTHAVRAMEIPPALDAQYVAGVAELMADSRTRVRFAAMKAHMAAKRYNLSRITAMMGAAQPQGGVQVNLTPVQVILE